MSGSNDWKEPDAIARPFEQLALYCGDKRILARSVAAIYSAAAVCPTALLGSASVVIPIFSNSNCAKPGGIGS